MIKKMSMIAILSILFAGCASTQPQKSTPKSNPNSFTTAITAENDLLIKNPQLANTPWHKDLKTFPPGNIMSKALDELELGADPQKMKYEARMFKTSMLFTPDRKDEFGGQSKSYMICPATYFQEFGNNGKEFVLNYISSTIKQTNTGGLSTYGTSVMISSEIGIWIQNGYIPSTLTIDVKETEYQGKGFRGQMSTQQLGLMLSEYINEPGALGANRKILISAVLLKNKVNIFTPDKNFDCNLELRRESTIHFFNDKSAETIKFLGSLANNNPQKATEALLKDPEVREMFEKYKFPSNN